MLSLTEIEDMREPDCPGCCDDFMGGWFSVHSLIAKIALALCGLIVPPILIYSAVSHHHCGGDVGWTVWMGMGAPIMFILAGLSCVYKLKYRHSNDDDEEVENGSDDKKFPVLCLLYIFGGIFFIWWVTGFSIVFGDAQASEMHENSPMGIFADPVMKDRYCKVFFFWVPFWVTMIPWIFLGYGALSFFVWLIIKLRYNLIFQLSLPCMLSSIFYRVYELNG